MNARVINMTGSTPVLNRLKYLRERKFFSFHALPKSSYGNSDIIGESNDELTEHFECSVTGELFDSFFFPSGIISESQNLTAKLYKSDYSFYITGGTSTANQIAISALYKKGDRVLVDKNCHQSVHFHIRAIGAEVHYICPDLRTEYEEISAWSYENLEKTLLTLQGNGKICDMVILTAQSYEGVIYDIPGVLARLLAAGITTRKFFIDEAWGSLNYFSEDIRPLTVMNIDSLLEQYPDLEIICTHSAHKSLFCLRQASLIHCRGTDNLAERIETAKYSIHTTSPSYPIIASLDNAQAVMSEHGNALATHSRSLVDKFVKGISSLKKLGSEAVSRQILNSHWHVHYDPTKVILDVSSIGTGVEIKQRLCEENIYVKRVINNFLLFNFHIGINEQAVSALISALDKICQDKDIQRYSENEISDKFIIPYPPGVPLVFPGEVIDEVIKSKIESHRKSGFIIIAA